MPSHQVNNAKPLTKNKRSPLSLIIVMIAAAVGGALFEQLGFQLNSKEQNSVHLGNNEFLSRYEKQLNRNLPKRIDPITIWESVSISTNEALLIYHIEGVVRKDMSVEFIENLKQMAEPQLADAACTPPSYSSLFARNIMVTYVYNGDTGNEIARFSFTKEKCNR